MPGVRVRVSFCVYNYACLQTVGDVVVQRPRELKREYARTSMFKELGVRLGQCTFKIANAPIDSASYKFLSTTRTIDAALSICAYIIIHNPSKLKP